MSKLAPLVSAEDLAAARDGVRILDPTTRLSIEADGLPYTATPARDGYLAEHVPGAVFADLPNALSDPDGRFNFTLPTPSQFAEAASALGIGDDTHVVVYDTAGGMWATRVWWLLRTFGHDAVSVLDGGLAAWKAAGLPTESGDVTAPPAVFSPRFRPELVASTDEVRNLSGNGGVLVNALDPATFRGEQERNPYPRRGRIPGSTNLPRTSLLDPTTGRFLDAPTLTEKLQTAGILGADRSVSYCGGGIAATLPAFAAYVVGGAEVAVYDGSLSEWTANSDLPVDLG